MINELDKMIATAEKLVEVLKNKRFGGLKVTKIDRYRDGGTKKVMFESHDAIFIDNRIRSKTKGSLYDRHPNDAGARKLIEKDEIAQILGAVDAYYEK